jgi:hypothetical protein
VQLAQLQETAQDPQWQPVVCCFVIAEVAKVRQLPQLQETRQVLQWQPAACCLAKAEVVKVETERATSWLLVAKHIIMDVATTEFRPRKAWD